MVMTGQMLRPSTKTAARAMPAGGQIGVALG